MNKSNITKSINVMKSFKRTSYWTVIGQLEATGFRVTKRRAGMYFLYQIHGNKFIASIKQYNELNAFAEALSIIGGIVRYNG